MTRSRFKQFFNAESNSKSATRIQAVKVVRLTSCYFMSQLMILPSPFLNQLRDQCLSLVSTVMDDGDDLKYEKYRQIIVKLEKENCDLHEANLSLNKRLGLEVIMDTSSDSSEDDNNFKTVVNTQHYQIDGLFAKRYYFITNVSRYLLFTSKLQFHRFIQFQTKGDRYYLNETLKLRNGLVETLQKMNSTYPRNTADYDVEFLCRTVKSIFGKDVLQKFSKSRNLRDLTRSHLKFLKGVFMI